MALALVGACSVEATDPTAPDTPATPGVRAPARGVGEVSLPADMGGTDPAPVTGPPTDACTGIEMCDNNQDCLSCYIDGECATGPDPVWDGSECVCAQGGLDPRCDLEYCCAQGDTFSHALCDCVPGGGGSGSDTGSGSSCGG